MSIMVITIFLRMKVILFLPVLLRPICLLLKLATSSKLYIQIMLILMMVVTVSQFLEPTTTCLVMVLDLVSVMPCINSLQLKSINLTHLIACSTLLLVNSCITHLMDISTLHLNANNNLTLSLLILQILMVLTLSRMINSWQLTLQVYSINLILLILIGIFIVMVLSKLLANLQILTSLSIMLMNQFFPAMTKNGLSFLLVALPMVNACLIGILDTFWLV